MYPSILLALILLTLYAVCSVLLAIDIKLYRKLLDARRITPSTEETQKEPYRVLLIHRMYFDWLNNAPEAQPRPFRTLLRYLLSIARGEDYFSPRRAPGYWLRKDIAEP